jgi:hypothetical protein
VLGALAADGGKDLLIAFLGEDVDLLRIDLHVLAFTAVASIMTGVVFGLAPAFRATQMDVNSVVKWSSQTWSGPRSRLSKSLLVGQVALSLILVVTGGLLFRTLETIFHRDIGFRADHLVMWRIRPPDPSFDDPQMRLHYAEAIERMKAIPGIVAATTWRGASLPVPGSLSVFSVGADFFKTMGIPIVAGRDFDSSDKAGAPKVAIIGESFARRYFQNTDPIGKELPPFAFVPGVSEATR